jgi:crossover junction endodeoxyribonuclease RusA
MILTIQRPPSANQLFRAVPGRGVIKSKIYREWLAANTEITRTQADAFEKICGPFEITFEIERPDKRRRDLDNHLKALFDLLTQSGAIRDDSDCIKLTALWKNCGKQIKVIINAIPETDIT